MSSGARLTGTIFSALLLLATLQGCKGSGETQSRKLMQERESWEATQRLVLVLRDRGALPSRYTQQTLQAIDRELEQIRQKAERQPL